MLDKNGVELVVDSDVIIRGKITTIYHDFKHNQLEIEIDRPNNQTIDPNRILPRNIIITVDAVMVEAVVTTKDEVDSGGIDTPIQGLTLKEKINQLRGIV